VDLREIHFLGVDCMLVAQDRFRWLALVKTVMSSIKYGEFLDWLNGIGSSRRAVFHGVGD
jgi:hypothetical protein